MHSKENTRNVSRQPNEDPWINRWARQSDLSGLVAQVLDLETLDVVAEYDPVATTLAKAGRRAGSCWLWCLRCHRFFRARYLELDALGNWQRCPFEDCCAAGFDMDIFTWESGLHERGWPQSTADLFFGMRWLAPQASMAADAKALDGCPGAKGLAGPGSPRDI